MAGDTVPVGPAGENPAAEVAAPVETKAPSADARAAARAAKIAAFKAGAPSSERADEPKTAAPVAAVEKPVEVAEKFAEVEEKPDAATAKSIEAIEKRDRRAREQLAADRAAWKAERDLEIAELTKLKSELTGKATSLDDLKRLAKTKPLEALKHLGIESEDDLEVVARQTYAVSKSGKADPKNKAFADQVAEKHGVAAELAELKAELAKVKGEFSTRDQRAEMERFQTQYLDEAVKAIPAEPTFIALAHTANPAKARAALLELGQRIERETGETPSHAEVIAEYERNKRAELADTGLAADQIEALLRKPAPPAKPLPKTLDLTARGSATAPINGNPTREQKLAAARAERLKRNAEV